MLVVVVVVVVVVVNIFFTSSLHLYLFFSFSLVQVPKKFSGAYGDNGFLLEFHNPSDLGKDTSGNDNHFTPFNFDSTSTSSDSAGGVDTFSGWVDVANVTNLKTIAFGMPGTGGGNDGSTAEKAVADCNSLPKSFGNAVKFQGDNAQRLQRVVAHAGNRKIFTLSAWVSINLLDGTDGMDNGNGHPILAAADVNGKNDIFGYASISNTFRSFYFDGRGGEMSRYKSNQQVQQNQWYHVVWAVDTTQAAASERVKLYVDGTLTTASDMTVDENRIVHDGGPTSESSDGSCSGQGSNGGPNSDPRQGPDSSGKPNSLCLPVTEAG